MSLEQELKELLLRELKIEDVNPDDLWDDAPLFSDEGWGLDSLDAVEIVVLLQKHYQVEIKNMEEGRAALTSIRTLADYIRTHRPIGQFSEN